jgi:hypothetical protein
MPLDKFERYQMVFINQPGAAPPVADHLAKSIETAETERALGALQHKADDDQFRV